MCVLRILRTELLDHNLHKLLFVWLFCLFACLPVLFFSFFHSFSFWDRERERKDKSERKWEEKSRRNGHCCGWCKIYGIKIHSILISIEIRRQKRTSQMVNARKFILFFLLLSLQIFSFLCSSSLDKNVSEWIMASLMLSKWYKTDQFRNC